jgi:acyl carrier protein
MSSDSETKITALVASTLNVDPAIVRRDSSFAGDLAADSLAVVTLILAVEDEYGIDIHDEDAAELLTVEQLIEYVTFALAVKEQPVTSRSNMDRADGRGGLRRGAPGI